MSRKRAPLIHRPSNTDFDWRITCKELSEATDTNRIVDLSVLTLGVVPTHDSNLYMSFMKLLASKITKIQPSPLLRQELIRFLVRTVDAASTVAFTLVRYLIKHDRSGPVQWGADALNLSVLLVLELAAWDSLSDGHLHRDVLGRTLARQVTDLYSLELGLVGIRMKQSGSSDPILNLYRRIIWHEDLGNIRIPSTGKHSGLVSCLVLNVLFWSYMLEDDERQAIQALELIPGNASEEVENQTRVLLSQLGRCDLYGNTNRLDKLIQAAHSGECFLGMETCTGENRFEIALLCLLRAKRAKNIIDSVSHALYALHCLKFSGWIRDKHSPIHFGTEGMIAAFYADQIPFSSVLPSIPPLQRYYIALEAVRIASRGYEQIGYVPGASWLLHRGLEYMSTLDRNDLVGMRLTRYRELFRSRLKFIHLTSRTAIPDSHIDHSLFAGCPDGESLRDTSIGIDSRLRTIREIVRKQHVLHSRSDLSHLERLDLVSKPELFTSGFSDATFTVKFILDPLGNLQVSIGSNAARTTCKNVTSKVLELYGAFSELLMRNKEAIASTSDTKTFWSERWMLNEEMGHLIALMDDELIGDVGNDLENETYGHRLIHLELPDILLGLPVERCRFLRDKICVRSVRIGHPSTLRESSTIRPSFVINPNGDCATTQTTILPQIQDTWRGRSGRPTLSDHEFVDLVKDSNVFLFSGHGGGEKHWSGSLVQRLASSEPKIALLMGCSSARPYGDYTSSFITPFHYLIGGFRIVVGTLWDVLGRELDRMTLKIIESISNEISLENLNQNFFQIIHEARAQAKLDHLSAASLVVYVASN